MDVRSSEKAGKRGFSPLETKSWIGLLSRFGVVGLLNTALGAGLIAVLDLGLHVEPHIANLVSYAVCVTISFGLSRNFVFRSKGHLGAAALRYLVVVGMAFVLNQTALTLVMGLTHTYAFSHIAGQLAGMATYSVVVFVACQLWVFRAVPAEPASPGA